MGVGFTVAAATPKAGGLKRLLRQIGATAEPALVRAFQDAPDPRVRVLSSRLLEAMGTEAALPALREAAARTGDGAVAREAEEALKSIRQRD